MDIFEARARRKAMQERTGRPHLTRYINRRGEGQWLYIGIRGKNAADVRAAEAWILNTR